MITTAAFKLAYGWSGDPIWVVHRTEHLVIGPASHVFAWVVFAKDCFTAMGLQVLSAIPQRGFRKGGRIRSRSSETPNKKLRRHAVTQS